MILDIDTSGADDDLKITGKSDHQRVFVDGVEYSPGGGPVKFFRCVRDSDGDYWIETDPATSGRTWRLMKLDSIRKDTLSEVIVKHGPLDTE